MEWNAMLVLGAYHGINPGWGGCRRGVGIAAWERAGARLGALPPSRSGKQCRRSSRACGRPGRLVMTLDALKIVVASSDDVGASPTVASSAPRFGGMQVAFAI